MTETVFGIKVRISGLCINRYRPIIGRSADCQTPIIGHCLIGASLLQMIQWFRLCRLCIFTYVHSPVYSLLSQGSLHPIFLLICYESLSDCWRCEEKFCFGYAFKCNCIISQMYNTHIEVDGRRAYCDMQINQKIMFRNSRNNMQ